MYSNDYMYAVERDPNSLAHYGIRGMKWGVRKAIESGNSARLSRQYAKAQKKLAKLEKRAAKAGKYGRRAALMGAGAAVAGGAAALGTKGVVNIMGAANRGTQGLGKALMNVRGSNKFAHRLRNAGVVLNKTASAGGGMNTALRNAAVGINKWGGGNSLAKAGVNAMGGANRAVSGLGKVLSNTRGSNQVAHKLRNAGVALSKSAAKGGGLNTTLGNASKKLYGVSNNTIARIGAGAIGAGLAVGAARNAYRAATAQKKAAKFKSAMNEAFKGTQYASGGNRQGKKRRRR